MSRSAELTFFANPFPQGIIVDNMSADGRTVVGSLSNTSSSTRAYMWRRGEGVSTIGDANGRAYDVSADGSEIAIGMLTPSSGDYMPYRWSSATNTFLNLGSANSAYGFATAISSDGSIVMGRAGPPGTKRLFRWTQAGGYQEMPGNPGTVPDDVVASSEASVAAFTGSWLGNFYGFRYSADQGYQLLSTLGGPTTVVGISPDGSTIVGQAHPASGPNRPVFWRNGIIGVLSTPSAGGFASDATEDGSVIVGQTQVGPTYHAFRWRIGGYGDFLDKTYEEIIPHGWNLYNARAITPDGRYIAGLAKYGSEVRGYVLDTVPEPATVAQLSGLSLMFVVLCRRRKSLSPL